MYFIVSYDIYIYYVSYYYYVVYYTYCVYISVRANFANLDTVGIFGVYWYTMGTVIVCDIKTLQDILYAQKQIIVLYLLYLLAYKYECRNKSLFHD